MPRYQGGGGLYQPGRYSTGTNFKTGRKLGGIQISLDATQMVRLANQVKGESTRAGRAAEKANAALAQTLQNHIATVLEQRVKERGRVQGMRRSGRGGRKKEDDRLAKVIRSEANRRVNQQGYSVGYLDQIPSVAQYYRGLEYGSSAHVGRYLSGVFIPAEKGRKPKALGGGRYTRWDLVPGGKAGRFTQSTKKGKKWRMNDPFDEDGREDEGDFNLNKSYWPGMRVKRRIKGYRYFDGGRRAFLARGGVDELALRHYSLAFRQEGMPNLAQRIEGGRYAGLPTDGTFGDTGF